MPESAGRVCSVQTAPTNREGKHLSQCGPTWGRAEWGRLRAEGVPMPPWGSRVYLPWRGSITNLPLSYPSLFGLQTPHREAASWGVPLHTVPGQPLLTRRCQRQPNMPLDPAQRLWVSPQWGRTPSKRAPCLPLPHWPPAGAPDTCRQDPEYRPRDTREEVPGGVTR